MSVSRSMTQDLRSGRSHVHLLLVGTILISLLAGACGAAAPTEARTSTTAQEGPQFGSEEFGLTMEQLTARVEQVEARISECMREQGFEYVPVDFVTVRKAMLADKSAPGLSDDEFRAQYGYGISTQFEKPAIGIGLGEQNLRVLENLSEADRVAYRRALWGDHADATFSVALEAEDFSQTGGCTRQAIEQTFTPEELSTSYINPGDALIAQDMRVVNAIEAWAECMREEGYEYDDPDEIEESIQERFESITEGRDPETLTGSALDALTELQGEERAVAQVDFECAEELLEPVIEQVEAEIYGAPQG